MDRVRADMAEAEMTEEDAEYRTEWRWNIYVDNVTLPQNK